MNKVAKGQMKPCLKCEGEGQVWNKQAKHTELCTHCNGKGKIELPLHCANIINLKQEPCSCGGNYDNCERCGGSGIRSFEAKKTFKKKNNVLPLKKEVSQGAKDTTKRTFKMFAGNKNTYISLNTSTVIVEGKNGTKNFFKILDNGNVEVTCSAIVPTSEGKIEIELEN